MGDFTLDLCLDYDRKLVKVTNIVTDIAGGFSGGTLNTALGFYAMPLKALFPHPYSLNPKTQRWEDCSGTHFAFQICIIAVQTHSVSHILPLRR